MVPIPKLKQSKKAVFFVFAVVLALSLARPAYGGVFSFLADFFSDPFDQLGAAIINQEKEVNKTNSQNIDLPEPTNNFEATTSAKSEIDTMMTNDGVILAEAGPLGTAADLKDDQAPPDLISVYTVHAGDQIEDIARMYNVSVNTIRWSNDLKKGDLLRVGDTLVILPVTGVQLTIKKGDTVKSLAKKYNGNADEIIAYNDLDPSKGLVAGEALIIPNGEEGTIVSGPKAGKKVVAKYAGPSYPGYYQPPLAHYVRTQGLHGNNAVDLAAPLGSPLYAAAAGRVIIAKNSGWNGGYGNYAAIVHPNGTQTVYGHMNKVYASVGQYVQKGEIIGEIGSTGISTGPHVHFQVLGAANYMLNAPGKR